MSGLEKSENQDKKLALASGGSTLEEMIPTPVLPLTNSDIVGEEAVYG
jgi:hypothetical protein